MENRDIIRYALNAFPRTTLWASMVDAYKVSKDLSKIRLDELFSEFELHEQTNSASVEKGIALYAGNKKNKRSSPPEESESESEPELDMETELVNLVRKFIKKGRKSTKDSKNKKPPKRYQCYECKKKGHFKSGCPNLKKKQSKKALQATWEESSDEEEEGTQGEFTFMTVEPESDSETESTSESESEPESEDEFESRLKAGAKEKIKVSKSLIGELYNAIKILNKKLIRSESKVESLLKEVKVLKKKTNQVSLTSHLQEGNSTQVKKLEEENSFLKGQVNDLKVTLEKFTLGSKGLDLILGSQRAVYNKTGLGFKSTHKSFVSLINRNQKQVQAWVPKSSIRLDSTKYWVPLDQIHYVDRPYQSYYSGGANTKLVYPLS